MQSNIQLRYVPWMTVTLFVTVWAIHLCIRWFSDPEIAREAYGIDFGNAITYITHAFIHADMLHITANTIGLLTFGSVTEAQVGRRWYGTLLLLSILAGSSGGSLFHAFVGVGVEDRVVGLSAAVSALTVVGIGALTCHWDCRRWTTAATLGTIGLLLLTALTRLWQEGLGSIWVISAAGLLVLGIRAVFYVRHRQDATYHRAIPVIWVFILFQADLWTAGWAYSTVGHLAGSVVGIALTFPALRGTLPTEDTVLLKSVVHRCWSWTGERVRGLSETRWFAPALLALSLFSLVIVSRATEFR